MGALSDGLQKKNQRGANNMLMIPFSSLIYNNSTTKQIFVAALSNPSGDLLYGVWTAMTTCLAMGCPS